MSTSSVSTKSPAPLVDQRATPNFVLGGAPKCGTTAMAGYLREHPNVWFSDPKEPFYWATDFPALRKREAMQTAEDYARLFRGAKPENTAIGEGSTLYLYSQDAIPNLLRNAPHTRFLFMIRRPWEIAHAYHMQMRFHFYEDVEDFEQAWRLQPKRLRGEAVPLRCIEPKLLQYQAIARVGSQLRRATQLIPPENLLVLKFDDFRRDPGEQYRKALAFLGLADDRRVDFPKQNTAMAPRVGWITSLLRARSIRNLSSRVKTSLPASIRNSAASAKRWLMQKDTQRESLSDDFQAELIDLFQDEVLLLEELLGCNLTDWKK